MLNIFIIDDSVLFRTKLTKEIESIDGLKVIGTANDPQIAQKRFKLLTNMPDVVILDMELPVMDGLTYLKEGLSKLDTKVIVCTSSYDKYQKEAIKAGAIEVVDKDNLSQTLVKTLKELSDKNITKAVRSHVNSKFSSKIIAIGASTGGLSALTTIFQNLPNITPPILIVQHMGRDITHTFIPKLNELSKIEVKEAQDGEIIQPNTAYFAQFNKHLSIERISTNKYKIIISDSQKVAYHKPSINILFNSLAQEAKSNAMAFILTGMGNDGVEGIKAVKTNGGQTFAQDEHSCIVFGMPQAAIETKCVDKVLSPKDIAIEIALG